MFLVLLRLHVFPSTHLHLKILSEVSKRKEGNDILSLGSSFRKSD